MADPGFGVRRFCSPDWATAAPVWWLGLLRVGGWGEYVFGFGVLLLGGVWGKGTNGLKVRGAARHKKSRLSAGGVPSQVGLI